MRVLRKISMFLLCASITTFIHANNRCDKMKIEIKNHLAESLLITKFEAVGGDLQPRNLTMIAERSNAVVTLLAHEKIINIEFVMHTATFIDSKKIKLRFSLRNGLLRCDHDDLGSQAEGNLQISAKHFGDTVTYNIE